MQSLGLQYEVVTCLIELLIDTLVHFVMFEIERSFYDVFMLQTLIVLFMKLLFVCLFVLSQKANLPGHYQPDIYCLMFCTACVLSVVCTRFL